MVLANNVGKAVVKNSVAYTVLSVEKVVVVGVSSTTTAPSLANTFVLESLPVGSSKSNPRVIPILVLLIALDLMIELYRVNGKFV